MHVRNVLQVFIALQIFPLQFVLVTSVCRAPR